MLLPPLLLLIPEASKQVRKNQKKHSLKRMCGVAMRLAKKQKTQEPVAEAAEAPIEDKAAEEPAEEPIAEEPAEEAAPQAAEEWPAARGCKPEAKARGF